MPVVHRMSPHTCLRPMETLHEPPTPSDVDPKRSSGIEPRRQSSRVCCASEAASSFVHTLTHV